MTPVLIITAFLQSIDPRIRKGLYLLWAVALALVAIAAIVDFPTGKALEVLTYVGGLLGVTAAANVVPTGSVEPHEPVE